MYDYIDKPSFNESNENLQGDLDDQSKLGDLPKKSRRIIFCFEVLLQNYFTLYLLC